MIMLAINTLRLSLRSKPRLFSTIADNHEVPVIILGGGPSGLFLSNLLSSHSIPHLLFDKRPQDELLKHPQAHFINLRSMELLRHEIPRVYNEIIDEMPPAKEWDAFHFGASVIGGKRLGRVVHPVDKPLRVGQRGDAMLVADYNYKDESDVDPEEVDRMRVSPCQPAHLAQNKFVSLLLEEARRANDGKHLQYNTEIIDIKQTNRGLSKLRIQTSNNTYYTKYLIGCDGVHSFARKHCNIAMRGDSDLQHMMNIHFRTNSHLSKLLMRRKEDQAMLHFVYNSSIVGAFVCHDGHGGEWVLQVPYFPPYQVPEVDFTSENVKQMIWLGLIGRLPESRDKYDFDILSVRSWTMSSQVAERYMNRSQNVLLVGDAAHAFPPAGGFGMNTGLQDAHNLAWRLALTIRSEKAPVTAVNSILAKYEDDRKPVASQNAALSVRNYQRTLRIAKACYLDAQHPQFLMGILSSPPMSLLPFETRQDMFRQLVKIAMMPLGSLLSEKNSLHANHVEKNVSKILASGGSLPLVFPRYELGFSYNSRVDRNSRNADDSAGYYPKIQVGHRLPHAEMEVLEADEMRWDILEIPHRHQITSSIKNRTTISLVDISSQLRRANSLSSPVFTLLVLGSDLINSSCLLVKAATDAKNKWNVHTIIVIVLQDKSEYTKLKSTLEYHTTGETNKCKIEYFVDVHGALYQMTSKYRSPTSSDDKDLDASALIMVRPDSHVANASSIDTTDLQMQDQVRSFIDLGFHNSLGRFPS